MIDNDVPVSVNFHFYWYLIDVDFCQNCVCTIALNYKQNIKCVFFCMFSFLSILMSSSCTKWAILWSFGNLFALNFCGVYIIELGIYNSCRWSIYNSYRCLELYHDFRLLVSCLAVSMVNAISNGLSYARFFAIIFTNYLYGSLYIQTSNLSACLSEYLPQS